MIVRTKNYEKYLFLLFLMTMVVGTKNFEKYCNQPSSKLFNKYDMFGKIKNFNISQTSTLLLL